MRRILLSIVILLTVGQALGQAAPSTETTYVVPKDETLPIDELSLLLTPLTRKDLAQEVLLWQDMLQGKLLTISEVQISLKYLNQDIQIFEDVQNSLLAFLAASTALNEASAAAMDDTAQTTADKLMEMDKVLIESRFNLTNSVGLALAAEAKASQVHNLEIILIAAKNLLHADDDNYDLREFALLDQGLSRLKARVSELGGEFDPNNEELMTLVTAEVEEILRKKSGVRDLTLEYLSFSMENREELVKRIRLIVSEWERKGASVEEVADITTFVNDVTSFRLDVADSATRWSLIQLWIKSEAGGMKLAKSIGRFLAVMLLSGLVAILVGKITSKALHRTENISHLMRDFIIRSIRRVIFLVGFMMSLSLAGVNIAPILGVIGAAGFVLAFALQSTLGNFASGIMIMIYKPFDVGDAIDAAGVMGVVKTMNLTSTIINTFDNKLVIVPNNNIWGGVITNITGSQTRRVDLVFRIAYGDDTDLAEKIIHEVLSEQEMILTEPEPNVQMHELSDFTVNFICRPWVRTSDYWNVRWELTRKIRARFADAGFKAPVDPGAYIKRMGMPPTK
jgi:small conductance mechanosensitive channel